FGFSVAIEGDIAVVGAYLRDGATTDTGAAYIFRNVGTSWAQEAVLTGPTLLGDQFGFSVSVSAGNIMVGSRLSDNGATPDVDAGSVFISVPAPITDCNNNLVPDNCDIGLGTSMDANANGIPDECENLGTCQGDITQNGEVDFDDIVQVITHWGP